MDVLRARERSGYILMETSLPEEELVKLQAGRGPNVFRWNGRECYGSTIHLAALSGDLEAVKHALQELVSYLLGVKADPELPNVDGRSALHLAYQTGSIQLIKLLHEAIPDWLAFEDGEIGVHFDKMSEDELADTAQLTLKSLHVLIDHLPHCVPKFLHRLDTTLRTWKQNGAEPPPVGMDGKSIAQFIKTQDIAGLMRECPEAACALLDYCSLEPEVTSGHNPLPTRVSFAPRTWTQSLQNALNLQNDLLVFHLTDQVWDYNDTTFKMPRWQHAITENRASIMMACLEAVVLLKNTFLARLIQEP
eukprot:g18225.t1